METRLIQCAACGAEIDLITNLCPYCAAGEKASSTPAVPASQPAAPQATADPRPPVAPEPKPGPSADANPAAAPPGMPVPAPVPGPPPLDDRALGLLLFEAEESLARGAAEKALVLGSKAAQERPESLTARALVDRARRELLRGRRRERLESRLREAEALFGQGEPGAERIVLSALKVVPDHAVALDLFRRLKERRLGAGTVEAETERELANLARSQVPRALSAAEAARKAGWDLKALLAIRRGLRLVPDDPQLLKLLGEMQRAAEGHEGDRARRHALVAQVRDGLELLRHGQIGESLRILRAVLLEDPDNARAQAAVQEVRRAWLERSAPSLEPVATPAPEPRKAEPPPLRTPLRAEAAPSQAEAKPRPEDAAGPLPRGGAARPRADERPRGVPAEVLLPRSRRHATPLGPLVLGGAGILLLVAFLTLGKGGPPAAKATVAPPKTPPASRPARAAPPPRPEAAGPLAGLDPRLRKAIEDTLSAYALALERADSNLLAAARPDLAPAARERLLVPFRGALNAATDVRVLDVQIKGDTAVVPVLRTDVIVGGKAQPGPPTEETLRFERRHGAWVLR